MCNCYMSMPNSILKKLTQPQSHQYIDRRYHCARVKCDKHYAKLKLLQNYLREHTGYVEDELMEVLLKDQPWCLKMYSKLHSAYE